MYNKNWQKVKSEYRKNDFPLCGSNAAAAGLQSISLNVADTP